MFEEIRAGVRQERRDEVKAVIDENQKEDPRKVQRWDLKKLDRGELVDLRRSIGNPFGANVAAAAAFYKAICFSPSSKRERDIWFACMCMESLWRPGEARIRRPFTNILHQMYFDANDNGNDSMKHRIRGLMDTPYDERGFLIGKFANFVRQWKAKNPSIIPDFNALAYDLLQWNKNGVREYWINQIFFDYKSVKKQNNN